MKQNTFIKQIIMSFGLIAFLFIGASYIVNQRVAEIVTNISLIEDLRLPTAQASKNLSKGISQSLADLRGWLILADPKFKHEREDTWNHHINPAVEQLTQLSAHWTNSDNIQRLEEIKRELVLFQASQEKISSIAHTLESTPATKLLIEEAKPLADSVLSHVTAMIEMSSQSTLALNEQALFKDMADFRGSFAQSLAAIRLFLISADTTARLEFENSWKKNEDSFTNLIAGKQFLSDRQTLLLDNLIIVRKRFHNLPRRMFEIRMSDQYDISHHLLKTQAAPSADLILRTLTDMVNNQRGLLESDIDRHKQMLTAINTQINTSIFLGLFVTVFLGLVTALSFRRLNSDIAQKSKELNDKNAINKGILDTSKDAIVSITNQGIIRSCNQTTGAMFGYSPDELLGTNIKILMPEEHGSQHDAYLQEHLRTGIKKDIWGGSRELIAKRKDGTTFPIFLSIGSVNSSGDTIFTGFIRNITEQKSAQDALHALNKNLTEQTERQETVAKITEVLQGASNVKKLCDSIVTKLSQLTSAGFCAFYVTEQTSSQHLTIVSGFALNGEYSQHTTFALGDSLVGQCAKDKMTLHINNLPEDYPPIKSGAGQSAPTELLLIPILFENTLLGVIEIASFSTIQPSIVHIIETVADDIGIVLNHVMSIEHTNRLLEKMQQQSNELQQQSQELSLSNAYKSDFLATMSHEIRTPMNGIIGMLNLLVKSELSQSQRKKATVAQSSAQSLLRIINDILDFSKIDAGKMDVESVDFDLRFLLEDVAELEALKAREKKLTLNLDAIGISETMVKGDPNRIRQVLVNLISNAIKFTHEGDIIIRANVTYSTTHTLSFTCSIEDTGIGIPADKKHQLFEAFRQADTSTTRKYGGTGLGLSISKRLCHLMGGDISLDSIENKGSTFTFTLPLEKSAQSSPTKPPGDLSHQRILLIDAHHVSRDIIDRQLSAWGAQVSTSDTGKSALAMLNRDPDFFDLVLLDTHLPDMDTPTFLAAYAPYSSTELSLISTDIPSDAQHHEYKQFVKPLMLSELRDATSCLLGPNTLTRIEQPAPIPAEVHQFPFAHLKNAAQILLVEDNLVNQEMMRFLFEDIGLTPAIASDGKEALDMLSRADKDHYSLVLMDCQMPVMDGYTATRQIRDGKASHHYKDIPIIALTANAMIGDKEKCINAGMNDYLCKPIDAEPFTQMLNKWLSPTPSI